MNYFHNDECDCSIKSCDVCNGEGQVVINEWFIECFCDGTTLEQIAEQVGLELS